MNRITAMSASTLREETLMKTMLIFTCVAVAVTLCTVVAIAQDAPHTVLDKAKVKYSPYPEEHFPNQVFFGDTHLHTSYSTDAGMIGNTLGPEEAYRFARGETVTSSTGVPARLNRPLDFLVVSDHAENLGLAPAIAESNPELLKNAWGKSQHDLVKQGTIEGVTKAYDNWMAVMAVRKDPLKEMTALTKSMWQKVTAAAEKYNEPGRFTAFIGYRVDVEPGRQQPASQRHLPRRQGQGRPDRSLFPVRQHRCRGSVEVDGRLREEDRRPAPGDPARRQHFQRPDVRRRHADAPRSRSIGTMPSAGRSGSRLYEATQIKGDGEAHPLLSTDATSSPTSRLWDKGSFGPQVKTKDMLPREYAREALKRGLAYEAKLGVNPFKFGMVGSTDAHTSLATTEENNFFGKVVILEPSADPIRFEEVITGRPAPKGHQIYARQSSASGLAAVWARENTREALWDAMARKEVYATTGTRLRVRVFGWLGLYGRRPAPL